VTYAVTMTMPAGPQRSDDASGWRSVEQEVSVLDDVAVGSDPASCTRNRSSSAPRQRPARYAGGWLSAAPRLVAPCYLARMERSCPKCGKALVAASRGVSKCSGCAGMFIPAQLVPFVDDEGAGVAVAADLDAKGGRCPVDQTILSRAEIDLGPDHGVVHLERCSSCRGVWFDRGEWALLADQQLLENIDQFWTVEWRTRRRRERNEREYERRQVEEFGPELFAQLQAIASRLEGYERRSQALAFLREASAD
jgi:Zn-finger nucleic acid-binding protein